MRFNTKEKAKELLTKFDDENYFSIENALENSKHNSLLCVNEIIETLYDEGYDEFDDKIIRWLEVKDEIEAFN